MTMAKTTPTDTGGQLDLSGGESPLSPGPHKQPPLFDTSGLARRPPASTASRSYHSPAWKGLVTQDPIPDELYQELYGDGSRMPEPEDWAACRKWHHQIPADSFCAICHWTPSEEA
jgi:hypothetical protein